MKTIFGKILISTSFFIFILTCQNALAAPTSFTGIENYDWFTRDTIHNLDFLDLTVSSNAHVNKTWSFFESGINYGGRQWRLANVDEVCAIWNLAQPLAPDTGGQQYYAPNYSDPKIAELGALFGWTFTSGSYDTLSGWTSTQTGASYAEYYVAGLWDQKAPYGNDYYYTTGKGVPGSSFAYNGAWLVAPVPIPGAVWLFGTGLVCFIGLRKKFKK